MTRLLLSFMITISLARWLYAELQIVAPGTVPIVNFVLDKTKIPTHDRWKDTSLEKAFLLVDEMVRTQSAQAEERISERPNPLKELAGR